MTPEQLAAALVAAQNTGASDEVTGRLRQRLLRAVGGSDARARRLWHRSRMDAALHEELDNPSAPAESMASPIAQVTTSPDHEALTAQRQARELAGRARRARDAELTSAGAPGVHDFSEGPYRVRRSVSSLARPSPWIDPRWTDPNPPTVAGDLARRAALPEHRDGLWGRTRFSQGVPRAIDRLVNVAGGRELLARIAATVGGPEEARRQREEAPQWTPVGALDDPPMSLGDVAEGSLSPHAVQGHRTAYAPPDSTPRPSEDPLAWARRVAQAEPRPRPLREPEDYNRADLDGHSLLSGGPALHSPLARTQAVARLYQLQRQNDALRERMGPPGAEADELRDLLTADR